MFAHFAYMYGWPVATYVLMDASTIFQRCRKSVSAIEIEWDFFTECVAYENIQTQYEIILKVTMYIEKDKINQTNIFLVKIHNKD